MYSSYSLWSPNPLEIPKEHEKGKGVGDDRGDIDASFTNLL